MENGHVTKVAQDLIAKLGISSKEVSPFWCQGLKYPELLYQSRNDDVRKEITQMSPETLGQIAVHGLGWDEETIHGDRISLYSVHLEPYLSPLWSGHQILVELATTAVIAEMANQFRAKLRHEVHSASA